jgi:hypothetical protein
MSLKERAAEIRESAGSGDAVQLMLDVDGSRRIGHQPANGLLSSSLGALKRVLLVLFGLGELRVRRF